MIKILSLFAILSFVPPALRAQTPGELVGKYQMDAEGGDILELRPDGSAVMAGDKTTWSADKSYLTVGADVMAYTLRGNRLLLTMGPVQLAWRKLSDPVKKPGQKPKAGAQSRPAEKNGGGGKPARDKAKPVAGGNTQDAQARAMLTGSAWCSFTYNKTSGTSTTRKVVFRPDGVLLMNDGAETYSSGYGGVAAGQSSSAGALRWKLENLRVYVDQGAGFQDIDLTATKNSNGYVILKAEGREYSMCD